MQFSGKGPLVAGVLAAIGASVCCVGPLVLLALGIGGSWVSSLTAMDPYRPVFIGLTLLFLGLAFRKLYLVPHHGQEIAAKGARSERCKGRLRQENGHRYL